MKKNLGYLQAFPIIVSFLDHFDDGDTDTLFAALERRDRVQVVEIIVLPSVIDELVTAMQETLPELKHLQLELDSFVDLPILSIIPDTFLSGSAPSLQTICISGISFPSAPTLLLSARDLVDVDLHDIPESGFIPPQAMVASLAALPKLESLTFGFQWGMSYRDRMRLPTSTRAILPALTRFFFDGLFRYFEDFVGQIDTPQLNYLQIRYLDEDDGTDFQMPQLSEFIDRSEKLKLSRFMHADLTVEHFTTIVELHDGGPSSFRLSIQEDAIGQVLNQLSALLSNVDRLFVHSRINERDRLGPGVPWLELFRPFTALKALYVGDELSIQIPLALGRVTSERAAEVLPALNLLRLKNSLRLMTPMKNFVAARQSVGRPITIVNYDTEFQERLHIE